MNDQNRKSLGSGGWLAILAGLYPFLFFGPVQILLAYPYPFPAWRLDPAFQAVFSTVTVLPLLIGFGVGWTRRFPVWSYVYAFFALLFPIIAVGILLDGKWIWNQDGPVLAGLLLLIGMLALLVFFTRHNLPLRDLWQDIRRDWTRLSLGLMLLPVALFGAIDHDEDPVLTIFVIGPVLILSLTALLALLAKGKQDRGPILAAGMLLAILARLPSGKWFYLVFWLVSAVIVFAPLLLELSPASTKASPPA